MKKKPIDLLKDTQGASSIEYALICSLIVIVIIVAINGLASETTSMWNTVSDETAKAHSG